MWIYTVSAMRSSHGLLLEDKHLESASEAVNGQMRITRRSSQNKFHVLGPAAEARRP